MDFEKSKMIVPRRFEAHAILRKNVTKHLKIITKERQFAQIKKRKMGLQEVSLPTLMTLTSRSRNCI